MYRALPPPEHRYGLALQVTSPAAGPGRASMRIVLVGSRSRGHINWCGEVRLRLRQRDGETRGAKTRTSLVTVTPTRRGEPGLSGRWPRDGGPARAIYGARGKRVATGRRIIISCTAPKTTAFPSIRNHWVGAAGCKYLWGDETT